MSARSGNILASKIFLFACVSFIIGIFIGLILQNSFWLIGAFFIFLALIFLFLLKKLKWVIIFCSLFFVGGFLRAELLQRNNFGADFKSFFDKEVEITGTIAEESVSSQKNQKIVVGIKEINGQRISERERVLIFTALYPEYEYGEVIRIIGKIEEPPIIEDFDYKEYLSRRNIFAVIFSPEITIISNNNRLSFGREIFKEILTVKSFLRENIYKNFSDNDGNFLAAMILGDNSRLSDEQQEILNRSGIRHLTAISGMNITILVNILMFVFLAIGFWRKQAFLFTIFFILFFVILTGLQPSAIRAGIMGFLYLFGQILGRQNDSSRAIFFGAAIMLAFNPFLFQDAGFQLSFLAIMGINYLFPIFSKWLRKIPNVLGFRNIIAMGLAAQIFTLPILIYNFGYISVVAPITNILVIPISSLLIIFGFLAIITGIISHILAFIFIFPCWIFSNWTQLVARFFAFSPFSSINLKISWVWIIIYYLFLSYLIWRWKKSHRFQIIGF
ncbi:MAG: ComEC/Rec2 family competence protein [Candidatus Parcubacteria bacterium]|nr:ComEC/Rec2 family competence protein [Candidatus Parcubacteria bacterium]